MSRSYNVGYSDGLSSYGFEKDAESLWDRAKGLYGSLTGASRTGYETQGKFYEGQGGTLQDRQTLDAQRAKELEPFSMANFLGVSGSGNNRVNADLERQGVAAPVEPSRSKPVAAPPAPTPKPQVKTPPATETPEQARERVLLKTVGSGRLGFGV